MPLFALTIFTSAFLLFQVQPLIGRALLPWFGGTPSVWTTCMLFFQALLLVGYGYAHWMASRVRLGRQVLIHGSLLATGAVLLAVQQFAWDAPLLPAASLAPPDSSQPIPRLLGLLGLSVGLPYFLASTTGPLLQSWFARSYPDRSAYRLYSLSNLGSMLALLSYPFVVEPLLPLRWQGRAWAVGFALFVAACVTVGIRAARRAAAQAPASAGSPAVAEVAAAGEAPGLGRWLVWIALAATPSMLLLATTNQICMDVAVVPFLWVVPLVLYLLSFVLTFESDRWYTRRRFLPVLVISSIAAVVALEKGTDLGIGLQVGIYLVLLFAGSMICHGELARLRPPQQRLTGFYLAVSIGGALGGLFVGIAAPLLFDGYWELHVSVAVTWLLALVALGLDRNSVFFGRHATLAREAGALGFLAVLVAFSWNAKAPDPARLVRRGFYGILKVTEVPGAEAHVALMHGRIVHGIQLLAEERRLEPTTYYGRASGVALALEHHPRRAAGEPLRVGVVGLGVGTLAAYARPGDTLRFYEINPEVVSLAEGEGGYFDFLKQSPGKVEVVLGDARISLERELREGGPQHFDVLVVDAFSSDSIPAHLLTLQAFELYRRHLAPGGVVAIHTSNRFLELEPIVWRLAERAGLRAGSVTNPEEGEKLVFISDWTLLGAEEGFFSSPAVSQALRHDVPPASAAVWTDDYAPLLTALPAQAVSEL
jgi:hypothetical protein